MELWPWRAPLNALFGITSTRITMAMPMETPCSISISSTYSHFQHPSPGPAAVPRSNTHSHIQHIFPRSSTHSQIQLLQHRISLSLQSARATLTMVFHLFSHPGSPSPSPAPPTCPPSRLHPRPTARAAPQGGAAGPSSTSCS